jgi:hypothetical protein
MPHSVLVVPVPAAELIVRDAHITLLSPFAGKEELTDGLMAELEGFFADCLPFSFRLAGVSRFPGGTMYLSPEPMLPFRSLTHELFRRFPEYPPYGGEFDDVVPHLSIPDDAVVSELPITAYATTAVLRWHDGELADVLATFPFGTAAA